MTNNYFLASQVTILSNDFAILIKEILKKIVGLWEMHARKIAQKWNTRIE